MHHHSARHNHLTHKRINMHHIMKSIGHELKPVTHLVAQEIRSIQHVPTQAFGALQHMSQNMILPLLLVGGIVLFIYIKK